MKPVTSLLALAAAVALFVFSAVATMSDAQGAFVFVVTLPAMIACLSFAAWLSRGTRALFRATVVVSSLLALFFVSAFVPGLHFYSDALMQAVEAGYKAAYGVTPYAAHHQRVPPTDIANMIRNALEEEQGKALNLRGLPLSAPWVKLCLVPISAPGDYANTTVVQLVQDGRVLYQAYLSKTEIDFEPTALGRCVAKDRAVFQRRGATFGFAEP